MNIIGLASLISALLVIDHFVKYPINVDAVKAILRSFKDWCRDNGSLGLIVYGVACWLLVMVMVICWPWSY